MTLDAQSPYASAQRRALKNMTRARRAQDTLIIAYCDTPSNATEARLNAARACVESCLSKFLYINSLHCEWVINSRHCEWVENQLSLMRAR